ncbi:virulence factor SrfC family protein [Runella sp. SP2]|uniref:virulence factor SrfC family protein n=1 Tax=Runella sp. SP2 TaxID=2268026 RepID=UPI000F087CB3|nr:virulence factor SrfC family protein [Runella sp. SP2]AYQ36591.1 hypothetical protein DTQ70_30180 [Runella sp. SP2]
MPNLSQQQLQNIADNTGELGKILNEGVNWVKKNLEGKNNDAISYELKRHRRTLNKVRFAVVQKPTIALFGASQAGKSYLVKNILCDETNQLKIPDHRNSNNNKNFITDINPEGGGGEATSLVTRFTYTENTDVNIPPVKIRFLSPKDIFLVILDSYFSDFSKRKNAPEITKSDIEHFLETLKDLFGNITQHVFSEDDVYDIEEYLTSTFESNQKGKLIAFKDAAFWKVIADNIHKIAPQDWTDVFSIIWGNSPELNKLCKSLIDELQNINFSTELYADFDAVLRDTGAILDVKVLNKYFVGAGTRVTLVSREGKNYGIDASHLCALSSEVIFNISTESVAKNPFIKNIDILDFPGARSRLKQDENDTLTDENLTNMLLRGKVAYLFNSYSNRYEINNLFFITNSSQSNVSGLAELVNNWISYNIGSTVEERTYTLSNFTTPPIFIIFTFWNRQLDYDQDNDPKDLNHKWELRFSKLFEDEITNKGNFKWPKNWTKNGRFHNYFLLRDFKYSKDTFEGFELDKTEKGVRNERQQYYSKLKDSFITSNLVSQFFTNPEVAWENTSTINNDGSQYIISHIAEITTNEIRTNRYLQILKDSQEKVENLLNREYHSENADKQIIKAAREAAEIQAIMNKIFGLDAFQFGNFIENFTVQEKEIYEFFHDELRKLEMVKAPERKQYQLYREASPKLSSDLSFDENLQILMEKYFRDSLEDTVSYFESLGIDLNELFYGGINDLKNNSEMLAEGARDFWFNHKLKISNFSDIIELGLDENLLIRLFENLKVSFDKYKVTKEIAKNIRTYVDTFKKIDSAEDMVAHITAGIINEFATSCGWSFYPDDEKQKVRSANNANRLNLSLPANAEVFVSLEKLHEEGTDIMSLEKLLDYMSDLNEHLNKIPLDMAVVKMVPMIKNYRSWREKMTACFVANCDIPTYNIEANRQLGLILNRIKLVSFV